MTKEEYNEAAALVVRLRKDLELHTDALERSNTQCAEYLRKNEQLQARLTLESETNARGLAEAEQSIAFYRLSADTLDRLLEIILEYGADESDDISGFIERLALERDKLKGELVEVRAALASTTEQRDSLKRTLDEWERADTKPHARVTADDVADHVVPPVLEMCMTCHECGGALRSSPAAGSHAVLYCRAERCSRKNTAWQDDVSPYHGPCKSATQVRHE